MLNVLGQINLQYNTIQQKDILQEKKIVGSDIARLRSLKILILVVHSFFDVEFFFTLISINLVN